VARQRTHTADGDGDPATHLEDGRGGGAFDPGWLFVVAGLLLVGAVVLVPAWRDVERLRGQVAVLERRAEQATARDRTGRETLESLKHAVRAEDSTVYNRLVSWQWNLVPLGDEAIIRETHDSGIPGWVEARTPVPPPVAQEIPPTRLERLLTGPVRPWILAAGGMCLLVGIIALPLPGRATGTAAA
jgi:hypothetical protein